MNRKENTTVVLVDEDDGAREDLADVLREEGYDCACFSQSLAALSYLSQSGGPADLLVTDSHPSGMGGIELLREVKSLDPQFPVILLSHLHELGLAIEAVRAGADDLLRKPVPPSDVVPLVQRCLQSDRLEREAHVLEALRHYIAPGVTRDRRRGCCGGYSASSASSGLRPCSIPNAWPPTAVFSPNTAVWKRSNSTTSSWGPCCTTSARSASHTMS